MNKFINSNMYLLFCLIQMYQAIDPFYGALIRQYNKNYTEITNYDCLHVTECISYVCDILSNTTFYYATFDPVAVDNLCQYSADYNDETPVNIIAFVINDNRKKILPGSAYTCNTYSACGALLCYLDTIYSCSDVMLLGSC